nr:toxin-antitoxin system HicB family antitoxin [uncultured Bacteroides sp.]
MKNAVLSPKKQTAFRLNEDLLERLKVEARRENRSLNNYVESVLMDVVSKTPNQTTLEAMKDAKENKDLEILNVHDFEKFVASL